MKPIEIVQLINSSNPELFSGIPEKKASKIVKEVLVQLGKQIEGTENGRVAVPGLGNFRVRQVEVEKEGEKSLKRRVSFKVPSAGGRGKGKADDDGQDESED